MLMLCIHNVACHVITGTLLLVYLIALSVAQIIASNINAISANEVEKKWKAAVIVI
jgi:hypothetical protein